MSTKSGELQNVRLEAAPRYEEAFLCTELGYSPEQLATVGRSTGAVCDLTSTLSFSKVNLVRLEEGVCSIGRMLREWRINVLRTLVSLVLALTVGTAWSQQIIPELLDLSSARASLAGPDSVYIRSVRYDGDEYSALFRYDGVQTATVTNVYGAAGKAFPDSVDLILTGLRFRSPDRLDISDVVVNGSGFSGTLRYEGGTTFTVDSLGPSEIPASPEQRLAELEATNRSLEARVASLQGQAQASTPAATRVQRTVTIGAGRPLSGTWQVSSLTARQTDASARFAKLVASASQISAETTVGIRARAPGSGWIGYGFHFMASASVRGDGYGFGRSYLVWMTRDPAYYGNDTAYLQLYESFDDTTMVQLDSVAIPEQISSTLGVEATYDRSSGTITVSVNDVARLTYTVAFPIQRGTSVALRTLGGPIAFSDVYVRAR